MEAYRRGFIEQRARCDNGERNEHAEQELLDDGEALIEQCDFLEGKLDVKVCM